MIETADGIVVVAGCSHPTIERIVAAAKAATNEPIHLVIGGMHLIPAPPNELRRIAQALHDEWRVRWLAPAHCTGEPAFEQLQAVFADRYVYAGLGTVIPIAGDALVKSRRIPSLGSASMLGTVAPHTGISKLSQ